MTRARGTFLGFLAVVLWSFLALFTVATAPVAPFQLAAMSFAIGGGVGLVWTLARGELGVLATIRPGVYAFGIAGLFGYHALYFSALRLAPAAEAGLIAYLWPLLIVLFSGFLPGERLGIWQVLGAGLGLAGAAVIALEQGAAFSGDAGLGYLLALACAVTWAGYSLLSRRLRHVPTAAVTVFCLGTSLLALPLHLLFEPTIWPAGALGWGAVVALGLGPVGLAFYLWDAGVKHGDIQLLGVAAYGAPILSTLALVAAGLAPATLTLLLAAILITAGAALAATGRST